MKFSIQSAREASRVGNYYVSVLNYLTVLRTLPYETRKKYLKEFCNALTRVIREHSEFCKDKKLVFTLSRDIFPTEPDVLVLSMQYLYHSGDLFGALEIANESFRYCKEDEQYLSVLVNTENIKSHMFDQWHWGMLSDKQRNRRYFEAISLAVGKNNECRVLDIGGGTALLSIFASRFSDHIYCCEMSKNMCNLAEKIIKGNNKIHLIQKHSQDLNLEHLDFQRVDVVVTETMDSGLFGEKIVSSLLDAHRRLVKENPLIIPYKASVFGVLVECEQIFLENVLTRSNIRFVSHFVKFGSTTPKEPYCCAYMNEVKGGYLLLTEPVKLLEVDFNNMGCLQRFRDGLSITVPVVIRQKGIVHAVITWFRCELFPGVQLLSSHPTSNSCWQQAIFPLPVEYNVDVGDHITLGVSVREDRLSCEILSYSNVKNFGSKELLLQNVNRHATLSKSVTASNRCLKKSVVKKACQATESGVQCSEANGTLLPLVVLENTDFLYANDYALEDFFFNSFLNVFQPSYRVVDLTNLSTVSLKLESSHCFYSASCIYYNPDYRIVMDNCSNSKRNKLLPLQSTDFPCKADVVLFWPLNSSGFLNEVSLNQIIDMKIINPNAVIIPACVKVIGCIVSCPSVTDRSKLDLDVCVGADLSFARSLAVSYYYDIEVSTLQYQQLSEHCELMSLPFDQKLEINSTELPQFLQQCRHPAQLKVTSDGYAGGILFWFNATFRSHNYCSAAENTNARCAVFVFKEQKYVRCGETVRVNTSLYHGNFVIET